MRLWRLAATRYASSAFDGEGAARYTGRWNSRGVRMVYTADSLALATLELAVHLAGAVVTYTAIEVEVDDALISDVDPAVLRRRWRTDPAVTQRAGDAWARSSSSLALRIPSVLVDPRSNERNVLLNPAHPRNESVTEVQRFNVTLDERLGSV